MASRLRSTLMLMMAPLLFVVSIWQRGRADARRTARFRPGDPVLSRLAHCRSAEFAAAERVPVC
jgi:hypothetical protein